MRMWIHFEDDTEYMFDFVSPIEQEDIVSFLVAGLLHDRYVYTMKRTSSVTIPLVPAPTRQARRSWWWRGKVE
jgi:hypothetical protein